MADLGTIPALLLRNGEVRPDKPAIREKNYGIWVTHDWRAYIENVRNLALGLAAHGFSKGDKLAVIGDNRPHLYWAQLAAMCLGGSAVPVYQDSIARELAFVLNNAEAKVIVAEDQEQVDKILSIRDELPSLELLAYSDPRGMMEYDDSLLIAVTALQEEGRAAASKDPNVFAETCRAVVPGDVALMCYTSGTTGMPKGVMLSHGNLVQAAGIYSLTEDVREDDDYLAYLPMAWVGDVMYGLVAAIMSGAAINCPEGPETVRRDMRELGPTGMIAAPRLWEMLLSDIQVRAGDSSPLKRAVFRHFRTVAEKVEALNEEGRAVPTGLRLQHAVGEFLVYGPVRDQYGLRRARWALTGGAPLGPDTFRFFRAFGINLKQVLRFDRGLRADLPSAGRAGQSGHRGARLRRRRGADCRIGRDTRQGSRGLHRILQGRGGDRRGLRRRGMVPDRRRRPDG